jgi:hypothetical protein
VVVGEHVHGQLLAVDERLHLAQFEPNVVLGRLDDVDKVFLDVTPTQQAEDRSGRESSMFTQITEIEGT